MTYSKEIFDTYIMKELLACSHVSVPDPPAGPEPPGHREGRMAPCGELTATSVFPSPSRKVPLNMSRAT